MPINETLKIVAGLFFSLIACASCNANAQTPCMPAPSAPQDFKIHDGATQYSIRLSEYEVCIPKHRFGLTVYKDNELLIADAASSVVFKNRTLFIGEPAEFYYSEEHNWLELRGWYSQWDNLWYVIRYQFFPGKPAIKVSFSITDRHDDHPTEASWEEAFWHKRIIQDLRLDILTVADHEKFSIEQINAHSGGKGDDFPIIIAEANTGPAYWSGQFFEDGYSQISHPRDKGRSAVRIYPRMQGQLQFALQQRPLLYPYPSANGVQVNVVINNEVVASEKLDQRHAMNDISGEYKFDTGDHIALLTTGDEEGDRIVFGNLKVQMDHGGSKSISPSRVPDSVLQSQNFALNIKDFWKKYPISAETRENQLSWIAIREPTILYGGAGLTIDFALSLDEQAHSSKQLQKILDDAPELSFPKWWLALDGEPSTDARYLKLLHQSFDLIHSEDVIYGNYGWKNYGDYQISNSYHDEKGRPVVVWAALQYDLTLGMMLSWASTGDQRLWDRARASVRNIMDVQVAKFHPYRRKHSGAAMRKGGCVLAESHWCTPAIPEYNYHTRALLLYSHLTGELWPQEIARMQIDNSAYFALTRTAWSTKHDRIGGWALRNLYYGHVLFGHEGTRYISTPEHDFTPMPPGSSYKSIMNKLVESIVSTIETTGGLSGDQPVWSAQVVEGLIIALENDMLSEDLQKRTLTAIETAVNKVAREQISRKDGIWWMVYYNGGDSKNEGQEQELSNMSNYGWFWLNSLVWVSKNTSSDHMALSQNLRNWLIGEFEKNENTRTPRAWSGLMGFPSYAINELNRE